jgi:hypothetical protein
MSYRDRMPCGAVHALRPSSRRYYLWFAPSSHPVILWLPAVRPESPEMEKRGGWATSLFFLILVNVENAGRQGKPRLNFIFKGGGRGSDPSATHRRPGALEWCPTSGRAVSVLHQLKLCALCAFAVNPSCLVHECGCVCGSLCALLWLKTIRSIVRCCAVPSECYINLSHVIKINILNCLAGVPSKKRPKLTDNEIDKQIEEREASDGKLRTQTQHPPAVNQPRIPDSVDEQTLNRFSDRAQIDRTHGRRHCIPRVCDMCKHSYPVL